MLLVLVGDVMLARGLAEEIARHSRSVERFLLACWFIIRSKGQWIDATPSQYL
jgi:hypothetical protein